MMQFYSINFKKSNLFFKSFTLLAVFLLFSCENEKYDLGNKSQSQKSEFEVKNGRLHFPSKESFAQLYNEYVNLSEDKLNDLLIPLYNKGFLSLRPIVTEKNEEIIFNLYKEKLNLERPRDRTSKNAGEVTTAPTEPPVFDDPLGPVDFIGDDTFAGFLNIDGEIQIGEDIYKYTDVGLFIVDETEYTTLEDYLGSESISSDPFIETELQVRVDVTLLLPENYPTPIGAGKIVYYRPSNYQSNTSSSTYSSPVAGSAVANDPNYYSFLSNLSSCDPKSGLFGNLFGDNDVCIDQYESKRRVKTKAFNYNYFLVYHMGVKCVHQFKGWTGFWRVEATDEIRLVVEAAQFEYDVDKLLGNSEINNNAQIKEFYYEDKKLTYGPNTITVGGAYGFTFTDLNHSSLPQIFQNTGQGLSFEWFGTGLNSLDNLIQNEINSNLNAKKLNEHFYNYAYNEAKSIIQQAQNSSYTPPANRTFGAKFPENGKILIQKSVVDQGLNIGVREKTFDWGAEIRFNAKSSGGGPWKITGGEGSVLARPKNFRVKIIGAARKGTSWHGSKFSVGID
ncbi:hypothetical protein [Flavobacterium defluvii]|uniref:Uncharacterized protein n=1 Tax=Flavobacterium defluvii TaxID=370979 RepID=A0A1M5HHJ0_9FLAO|nr:hypothetical protein [Flavobacterium defluvii]SHG15403.1 hypothetical protein SAMN05443663_10239 [Flavobacterium defluvii]